jgi:phage major head subunit gpT-like protein
MVTYDARDKRHQSIVGALLERFAPGHWRFDARDRDFSLTPEGGQAPHDGEKAFAGHTLINLARESAILAGHNPDGKSRSEVVRLAFQSTSDFPGILEDVANKSLRAGYEMVPAQWRLIAARRSASDFKAVRELTLNSSSRLEIVPEAGEFKRGKLVEGKETWKLSTYGKIISITRQAIINDDLGAFTRTPQLMGQEVAMLEADTMFGIITANGNLADGAALFSSTHSNMVDSGSTISIDSLGSTRLLMSKQTSTGGKTLNLVPSYLLVPAALAQVAQQYTSANYQAVEASKINPLAGRLTPIVEARLDAVPTVGGKVWYMFADPNMPNGTVLIYAYLDGQDGPYTETQNGFSTDGIEFKIRHDFGAAAVDYRGAVQNDGQ